MEIPNCPNCGSTLIQKKKDDNVFYTCPNWKPRNEGCEGFIWSPGKKLNLPAKPQVSKVNSEAMLTELILIRELLSDIKEKYFNL